MVYHGERNGNLFSVKQPQTEKVSHGRPALAGLRAVSYEKCSKMYKMHKKIAGTERKREIMSVLNFD